jgi:hypothetical protein
MGFECSRRQDMPVLMQILEEKKREQTSLTVVTLLE